MKRISFEADMNRVEIYDHFPLKDSQALSQFMSNDDGTFKEKRTQFEFMLYNAATKHRSHQRQFGESLKTILFSREYVSTHRWPSTR